HTMSSRVQHSHRDTRTLHTIPTRRSSDLIAANHIQAAQVEKVEVSANHNMTTTLLHHQPKTGLEAKFSMEFCLAILLLRGKASLGQFTDQIVQSAEVHDMIRRVHFYVDEEAEKEGYDKMT